jgi:hypothetical protein
MDSNKKLCTKQEVSEMRTSESHDESGFCEIRVKGHFGARMALQLRAASVTLEEDGITRMVCPVVDQAALHGLLKRVRDWGMPLLSVNFVNSPTKGSKEAKM